MPYVDRQSYSQHRAWRVKARHGGSAMLREKYGLSSLHNELMVFLMLRERPRTETLGVVVAGIPIPRNKTGCLVLNPTKSNSNLMVRMSVGKTILLRCG